MTATRTSKVWRTSVVALGAALAVATAFGPGQMTATRLGAGETVGFSTVSAADTIRSVGMLAEVPAGVSKTDELV
jgi:hypothetical protein